MRLANPSNAVARKRTKQLSKPKPVKQGDEHLIKLHPGLEETTLPPDQPPDKDDDDGGGLVAPASVLDNPLGLTEDIKNVMIIVSVVAAAYIAYIFTADSSSGASGPTIIIDEGRRAAAPAAPAAPVAPVTPTKL